MHTVAIVCFVALVSVGMTTEASATSLKMERVKMPPLRAVEASEPCLANITDAVEQVIAAGVSIGEAVVNCPKANNTADCVSDISKCAADLSKAAMLIDNAVTACGGHGSDCVADLLQITHDLAEASEDVSKAVSNCAESPNVAECVLDVIDIASYVDKIVISIEAAVKQCRSN